jgi:hypothetical protein
MFLKRVQQRNWDLPACDDGVAALGLAVNEVAAGAVHVDHSLGCLLAVRWASRRGKRSSWPCNGSSYTMPGGWTSAISREALMNAQRIGIAILATIGIVSGCATQTRPMASTPKLSQSLAGCDQVTGSRVRVPKGRTDCAPAGYPFRQFSADDIQATGQTDLNLVFQPRR